jgi:hypothetical protein
MARYRDKARITFYHSNKGIDMGTVTYRRENYCKFSKVHDKLLGHLEDGVSAKLTAKDLNISLPTYYK